MFRHLHIVACSPRSGTTLLHEAMVTCFRVDRHYDHEIRFNLVDVRGGEILVTKRPKGIMEQADVSEKSKLAMHDVRPIAPTSVGVWKKHPGRIKDQQQIHGSLTPDLIDAGYETPGDWEQLLDGIEPDLSRSRYPEKVYFWSRTSRRIDAWRKVCQYRRLLRRSLDD